MGKKRIKVTKRQGTTEYRKTDGDDDAATADDDDDNKQPFFFKPAYC